VENGHEAVVKLLLDAKMADANSKHMGGETPLLLAAINEHEAMVRPFLSRIIGI
jgi:ankyrin repeat protein